MTNKITLYKTQAKTVKRVKKQFRKGKKHILLQSPTGSGKTVMFSFIASESSKKNNKVLILTDRIELLSQAGGTLEKFEMSPYLIQAGTKFIDKTKSVYIGMSQTLRNRMSKPVWRDFILKNISLIIIDEAHKQEFNWLFKIPEVANIFVLGASATPSRSGKMTQLGLQYDAIVSGTSIKKLIKKGKLLNCDIYDCGEPDLSGVAMNTAKGDYSESAMFKKYDNAKLYKGLVKNYSKLCKGQKMIVFCCNVEHAIKTAKQLNKAGIEAKFVSSKKVAPREPRKWTPANEELFKERFKAYKLYEKYFYRLSGARKEVFDWFKNTEKGVLVNVDIATTGFDEPSLLVVALYRATTSLTLYLQMIGRGSRTYEGKSHFTVLDFGGNKGRFGPYDIDRDWGLWHEETKSTGGVPPMKICGEDSKFNKIVGAGKVKDGCKRLILASYSLCPFCGFKTPKIDKTVEADLALSAIVDSKGVSLKVKPFRDMTHKELKDYRDIKKHQMSWLWTQLYLRGGANEIEIFANTYRWGRSAKERALNYCKSRGL